MDKKRGQIDISFGMIFSIILIIIFLGFGFYAIKTFIGIQEDAQIKRFPYDLQTEIDELWNPGTQGNPSFSGNLPRYITSVCFNEYNEFENMRFTSERIVVGEKIEHLDISKTTEAEDGEPLCIENINGKVSFTLSKEYGETLVKIEK